MRHCILILALLAGSLQVSANDYKYLVLEQSDGTTIDLTSEGLVMTFADGKLVANDGTAVALSSLSQMYFSKEPTGIEEVVAENGGPVAVYSITGAYVGRYADARLARLSLPKVVYMMKSNGKTQRIAIR